MVMKERFANETRGVAMRRSERASVRWASIAMVSGDSVVAAKRGERRADDMQIRMIDELRNKQVPMGFWGLPVNAVTPILRQNKSPHHILSRSTII